MVTKICTKCKIEKAINDFHQYKSGKRIGKFLSRCKSCTNMQNSNILNKKYKDDPAFREKSKADKRKRYHEKEKNDIELKTRRNAQRREGSRKKYQNDPVERAKKAIYNSNKYHNDPIYKARRLKTTREWVRKNRNININFKLKDNLRRRVNDAIKKNGTKSKKTLSLIGTSIENLKKHLADLFTDEMTWENYGKWHIDHIIPCSFFELQNSEEQELCFHYTNLQPLWEHDNLTKSAKDIING